MTAGTGVPTTAGANHGCKASFNLGGSISEFGHELVIATHDGIHVAQPRAEHGAPKAVPTWLVKAADVARAATCIADDDNAAQFKQDGD